MQETALTILKYIVLITGMLDSYKYKLQAQKVCRLKSSGQISRMSLVYAIGHRIPLLIYVWLLLKDNILIIISCTALYTMLEAFYYVYQFYPYRNRGLKNFKKPSIWVFIRDIFSKNKYGKRL